MDRDSGEHCLVTWTLWWGIRMSGKAATAEPSSAGRCEVTEGRSCVCVGGACHDATSLPCSFLWKKWKNLCVGDVVCLSKDSIVPVRPPPNLEHPWGGSPSNPDSSLPHPRQTCSCSPAQSPVACATWKRQTSMGKKLCHPWGLGCQRDLLPLWHRDSQAV